MSIRVKRFDSAEALTAAVAHTIKDALRHDWQHPAAIVVPGGTTPHAAFQEIAVDPVRPSENAYLAYTDERHVPDNSPESNYGLTAPMIQALGLPDDRVLRIRTNFDLDTAAKVYEDDLKSHFARGGTIPLAMLGLGADGHTCSLFTEDDLAHSEGRLAIPVRKPTPPDRISITPSVLERAKRVVFVVAGESKAVVIRQLLEAPESVIAGRAVARCANVELWCA